MSDNEKLLKELVDAGTTFNYNNFATKTEYGFPEAYVRDYLTWKTKVDSTLHRLFGASSAVYQLFKKNESYRVLGNGSDQFDNSHESIIAALSAGIELLDFEVENEPEDRKVDNYKVFVVHGHDNDLKNQTDVFLRSLGLEPIILHRQADEGLTVIEKFEKHSDVGFAFVLLTPDDVGYPVVEEEQNDEIRKKELRGRQNVIFEFGYFVGKLGRSRVCIIYKEGVTLPNDVSGYLYKKVNNDIEAAGISIIRDLKAAGLNVTVS